MNNWKKALTIGLLVVSVLSLGACGMWTRTMSQPERVRYVEVEPEEKLSARVSTNGDGPSRTISVTGSGSATAAPDMATVQLGVDTKSESASLAANENAAKMNRVMEAIKGLGIADEDIQTTDYRIFVERIYEDGKVTNETEYRVTNQVKVTVRDLELVGPLLEAAIAADVNNVGGINFSFSDPQALERDARQAAMQDAKNKAQQLADGLGVGLGVPEQISEWSGGSPLAADVRVEKVMASAPPISGGQLEVNIQVSVSFGIE